MLFFFKKNRYTRTMNIHYTIKKQARKSIALKVRNGEVVVHAPFFLTSKMIHTFVEKHQTWIEKRICKQRPSLVDPNKISDYKSQAREYIPSRVKELAQKFALEYNSVKITGARSRWGSCTSKKNLNFSYRLILTPRDVIDYVIIHELAHTIHMNHSKEFWSLVQTMMPDYKEHEKYLKENYDLFTVSQIWN